VKLKFLDFFLAIFSVYYRSLVLLIYKKCLILLKYQTIMMQFYSYCLGKVIYRVSDVPESSLIIEGQSRDKVRLFCDGVRYIRMFTNQPSTLVLAMYSFCWELGLTWITVNALDIALDLQCNQHVNKASNCYRKLIF
jgi:hypothetical protein